MGNFFVSSLERCKLSGQITIQESLVAYVAVSLMFVEGAVFTIFFVTQGSVNRQ
jgi:hypothetical protein